MRQTAKLSHFQRSYTPPLLAQHLIERVTYLFGRKPDVLWVGIPTAYSRFDVQCWDKTRNALKYDGSGPIIAHPPCGPWGKYWRVCNQDQLHGIRAMEYVHRFGGVVEQPLGTALFKLHGREAGFVEQIDQKSFGHKAIKPTLLYWYIPGWHYVGEQ